MENIYLSREFFPRNLLFRLDISKKLSIKTPRSTVQLFIVEVRNKSTQFKMSSSPTKECFKIIVRKGISWSYVSASTNSLMHAFNGNRRLGYKIAVWNCRRGLLTHGGEASAKIIDIKLYLQKNQLEAFGIIESDLHGENSRQYRNRPLTTKDIHHKLRIEGYTILLPQSWYSHAQARIFVYIKEGIHIK